jgi:hypothetical protein
VGDIRPRNLRLVNLVISREGGWVLHQDEQTISQFILEVLGRMNIMGRYAILGAPNRSERVVDRRHWFQSKSQRGNTSRSLETNTGPRRPLLGSVSWR